MCVCVTLEVTGILLECSAWLFTLFDGRGTHHFTGTVSDEATSEMGYSAWPAGRNALCRQERPPSLRPVRRFVALELWPLTKGAQAPSPGFFSGFGFLGWRVASLSSVL